MTLRCLCAPLTLVPLLVLALEKVAVGEVGTVVVVVVKEEVVVRAVVGEVM